MKPIKLPLLVLVSILLASCSLIHEAVLQSNPVNTSTLKIGMTKEEARLALNKKPYGTVAAKTYAQSQVTIEVVENNQTDDNNRIIDNYWLYFKNGKLDRLERANPNDTPFL